MSIDESSTLADVAFAVCTALDNSGTTAVLTGGSAATFYAPEAHQSHDIDFVLAMHTAGSQHVLEDLGFKRNADFYSHPLSHFPLEFPPGPLMIGDDYIETWATETRRDEILYVLSPTDCCRDRLASFLFWDDFSGLEQALAVFQVQRAHINLEIIEAWCRAENAAKKWNLFLQRLG